MDEMAGRRQPATVRGRRLAAELSALRASAGFTREQVEEEKGVAIGTLFRIEKAQSRPQKRTLLALLDLYGVTDKAERDALVALSRQSTQLGWLQVFESTLPESYQTYISFESEADKLTTFEQGFVPGLLQTLDYTRAVIRGVDPTLSAEDIESRAQVRVRRQDVLTRKNPVALWAVVDEAVLHRPIGGADAMRQQLNHLVEAADQTNITIQIIPFEAGAHPGLLGSFVVMDFAEPDPPIVYLDTMAGELFIEKAVDVERYRATFQQLIAQALSPAESLKQVKKAVSSA